MRRTLRSLDRAVLFTSHFDEQEFISDLERSNVRSRNTVKFSFGQCVGDVQVSSGSMFALVSTYSVFIDFARSLRGPMHLTNTLVLSCSQLSCQLRNRASSYFHRWHLFSLAFWRCYSPAGLERTRSNQNYEGS